MGRKFVVQRTWNEEGEDIAVSLCESGFERFKSPVKFDSQQALAVCKTLEEEDSDKDYKYVYREVVYVVAYKDSGVYGLYSTYEKARADVEKLKAKGENVDEFIEDYLID